MKKRTRIILIITVFIIVAVVSSICLCLKMPNYVGSFSCGEYAEMIAIGLKPTYNKGEINNYFQACEIGIDVINDQFPITQERTAWYNFEMEYLVYRDEDSQLWLVYIMPRDSKWVVGGSYGVILTDNGDIVSCWGER